MSQKLSRGNLALYKRLMTYLRRYWKVFLLSICAMTIAAATEPAFIALMKPLIDQGFVAKDPATIRSIPLLIVGLFMLRGVTSYINEYSTSWLTGHLVQTMRQDVFLKLLRMPVSYYDNNQSGRLLSRVTYDVNQVTDAGFSVITVTVKDGITLLGLLGTLLYYDWRLTLICFIVFPAVSLCIRLVSRRLRHLSRESQLQMAQMTQVLGESIDCQRLVKVYGGHEYEAQRFSQATQAVRHNAVKQTATSSLNTGVTQFIIAVALAGVLYYAALRAQHNALTAGTFIAFLSGMTAMFAPIKRITNISQSLQRGLAAAESVFSFLDEETEPDHGRRELPQTRGELSFRDVGFRYSTAERDALTHIDLNIRSGETVALVGSSGSGKTTLVSLIPRFYLPSSGRVELDGIPIDEITLDSLRQHIALVSQEVVLFNDTVAANIAYGDEMRSKEDIVEAARRANALDFINELPNGFDTVIGENGTRLSGGQRQRLAIARALLKDASILILDEATSALDTQSERLVQAALENLMQNRTTIVIAHRLSTIENADRIVVMGGGKIVEIGTHAELLAQQGTYANLHRMQFHEQTPHEQ
ncbi:lipid A export permease/ATP-binding protein MsbA [Paludibacterium yongneupense]|uniref:lipid A export permease/ATP-binding protein MsbA n=1 Tax=Paludibacterium yongneupense TaxID=400061 RepID=UPI0004187442|nr:lipid A export permease/ATP-binding protein MsbA [Paludibacterium yongneupense]